MNTTDNSEKTKRKQTKDINSVESIQDAIIPYFELMKYRMGDFASSTLFKFGDFANFAVNKLRDFVDEYIQKEDIQSVT